jgi:hypothetical protein
MPPIDTSIWKQQGVAIVGNSAGDNMGLSVALSADARTIAIGSLYYNNYRIHQSLSYQR